MKAELFGCRISAGSRPHEAKLQGEAAVTRPAHLHITGAHWVSTTATTGQARRSHRGVVRIGLSRRGSRRCTRAEFLAGVFCRKCAALPTDRVVNPVGASHFALQERQQCAVIGSRREGDQPSASTRAQRAPGGSGGRRRRILW